MSMMMVRRREEGPRRRTAGARNVFRVTDVEVERKGREGRKEILYCLMYRIDDCWRPYRRGCHR